MGSRALTKLFANLVGFVLASLLVVSSSQAAPPNLPPGRPSSDLLPQDTTLMIDFHDLGASRARYHQNALYKVFTDPQVKTWLKPLTDKYTQMQQTSEMQIQAMTQLTLADIDKLLSGRVTIALVIPDTENMQRFLILTPKDAAHLAICVTRLTAVLPPEVQAALTKRQVNGVEVTGMAQGPGQMALAWALAGNTFVLSLGSHGANIDDIIRRMTQPGPSLSTNPAYVAAHDKLKDYDQDWMLYCDYTSFNRMVAGAMGQEHVKALGLDQVRAIAAAGKMQGANIDDKAFLQFHAGAEEGLIRGLVSPKPVDLDLLANLPPTVKQFTLTRLNVPYAYDSVAKFLQATDPDAYADFKKGIDDASAALGVSVEDDLIRALGDEALTYTTTVPSGAELEKRLKAATTPRERALATYEVTEPPTVVILTLKDPARVQKSLTAATAYALKVFSAKFPGIGGPGAPAAPTITPQQYKGVQLQVVTNLPQVKLSPACAIVDRYLVLAGSVESARIAIDRITEPGKTAQEGTMWAWAKRNLAAGNYGLISVSNPMTGLDTFAVTMKESVLQQLMPMMAMMGAPDPAMTAFLQGDLAPLRGALTRNATVSIITVKTEPDGVVMQSHTPVGASTAAAAVASLSGMMVPTLSRARGAGRATACANNLQQVGRAMAAFEGNNQDRMPDTLAALTPEYLANQNVFRCQQVDPRPPWAGRPFQIDYLYVGPIPADVGKASLIIVCDKPGNHPGYRNCLYYDGHVARVADTQLPQEFQRCLADLKPWLDTQPPDVRKRVTAFYMP